MTAAPAGATDLDPRSPRARLMNLFDGGEFTTITPERLQEVEDEINNRPRNVLAYQSPNDLLDHLRAS